MEKSTRLAALIGDIYDASVDSSRWSEALAGVRDFVGAATAGIVFKDAVASSGGVRHDDGSVDPIFTEMYFQRFVTLDPCTTGQFYSSVDRPVTTRDLVPHKVMVKSRFYQEWVQPQHFVDYMGAAIDRSGTSAVIFNVMRREGDGLFDDPARDRMRMIAPHIKRAVMIGRTVEHTESRASALAETLDGLSAGMFLVDAGGDIMHVNAAGQRLLADGVVVRSSGRRLIPTDARVEHQFRAACRLAGNGDLAIGNKGITLPLGDSDGDLHVAHVLPLSGGERAHAGAEYNATAAVFVRKAEVETPSTPEIIARAYRLTPTELRVLLAIVDVGGVAEVAEALGVADTTVKSHLAHLFAKTRTGRQADLVKLVAGFASPLAA